MDLVLVVLLDMGQLRIVIVKFERATTEFLAALFSLEDCIFRGDGRFWLFKSVCKDLLE